MIIEEKRRQVPLGASASLPNTPLIDMETAAKIRADKFFAVPSCIALW